MKRLTAILVAGIFVLAPLSVSAMEMMSDSNMKDVTGQAGVSIAVDDIVLYQEGVADVTYRDTDGMTVYDANSEDHTGTDGLSDAGITIDYNSDMKKLITIDAIQDASNYGIDALNTAFAENDDYADGTAGILTQTQAGEQLNAGNLDPLTGNVDGSFTSGLSALTIDVGTCGVLSDGITHNSGGALTDDVAGVIIGLPTVEITQYHNDDTRNIRVTSNDTAMNENKSFIQIEETGYSKMAILGGTVEIAPH